MTSTRWCDWEKLTAVVNQQFFADPIYSAHGPAHWKRVEQNGIWLSGRTQADLFIVRLFAWFHDSKRENENTDPDHGRRGADYAKTLKGTLFDLEDDSFEKLLYACINHTDEIHSSDTTIGTCWDADRLDLGRVGIIPCVDFMSTEFGKEVAKAGSFYSFVKDKN